MRIKDPWPKSDSKPQLIHEDRMYMNNNLGQIWCNLIENDGTALHFLSGMWLSEMLGASRFIARSDYYVYVCLKIIMYWHSTTCSVSEDKHKQDQEGALLAKTWSGAHKICCKTTVNHGFIDFTRLKIKVLKMFFTVMPFFVPQITIQSKFILRTISFLLFYNLKNLLLPKK